MKFTIVRSRFLEALKPVQNIIAAKGSLPVLQNVLIKAFDNEIRLTTTDLDISIRSTVACEVIEKGQTTLPVKLLVNSVTKAAECNLEIEIDESDRATIVAGSSKFKIAGIISSDFPKLPEEENNYSYSLPQQVLREMFRKTSYAAAQDDTRRMLKGVFMSFKNNKLTMVATDGRRLALVENEIEFPKEYEKDIVLPSKTVQELQRLLSGEDNIEITVNVSQISFKFGQVIIYSKLLEENYPNYEQVIPKESGQHITIDRQMLFDAVERANVMTMDEAHSTRLVFEENRLTVYSGASEKGEAKDEVAIKYGGEKIEIVFNPSYITDSLKAIDDDEITIDLKDGQHPAIIRCSIPYLYVIMPLRIN